MADSFRYMPVLQSRNAEFDALRNLSASDRERVQPVVSIVPPKWDFKNDAPACTMAEHVSKMALKFRFNWGPLHEIRVDGYLVDPPMLEKDRPHPLEPMMEIANAYGIRLIPVTGLGRSDSYQRLASTWGQKSGRGVTIRIEREDLLDSTELVNGIKETLGTLKLPADKVDILLDLKFIAEDEEAILADRVTKALVSLPYARDWRSAFLASTAFPENLGAIKRDSVGTIARLDWEFWKTIDAQRRRFDRTPLFADYAIAHPVPLQIETPRTSGNIRYAGESGWTVLKGHLIKEGEAKQMHGLCGDLIGRDEYCGRDFSAGDRQIARCAEMSVGPGNSTTWRFAGTSHHIGYVLRQLQTHFEKTRLPRRVP